MGAVELSVTVLSMGRPSPLLAKSQVTVTVTVPPAWKPGGLVVRLTSVCGLKSAHSALGACRSASIAVRAAGRA